MFVVLRLGVVSVFLQARLDRQNPYPFGFVLGFLRLLYKSRYSKRHHRLDDANVPDHGEGVAELLAQVENLSVVHGNNFFAWRGIVGINLDPVSGIDRGINTRNDPFSRSHQVVPQNAPDPEVPNGSPLRGCG